jgi:NAD(P)-dependent dehydrogenase (short-subunit alcohol dehydrogenase family)
VTLPGAVVVTGGGAGIGRATVLRCARRGAPVAVLDLRAEPAQEVAAQAHAEGAPTTAALQCDVRDEASVATAIRAASERLGPLRGLVTSAGIDRGGLVHELSLQRWREVLDTNLTGTFLCCKHVLAAMVEHGRGGSIVCLSSPWAERSTPGGASAYCASKGGVSALVRSLALDYAPHGIRVNAMLPGATETELMWANVPPDDLPAMRERTGGQVALGRLAEPPEIAAAITWMLSEEAAYMTGSQMVVDGGLMARGPIDA